MENLIKTIDSEVQSLKKGALNKDDFEQVFNNVRELYERLTVVRYKLMEEGVKPQTTEVVAEIEEQEQEVQFEEPVSFDFGSPEPEEVIEEPTPIEPEVVPESENQISLIDAIIEEEKSINDRIGTTGQSATLNDVLAGVEEELKSVSDRIVEGKIVDLHEAIEINEKYLFINDLFEADNESYKSALETLNNCNNDEEANYFINNELKSQYSWDEEGDAAQKFISLVKRKFN